jgi:hypothetical protein
MTQKAEILTLGVLLTSLKVIDYESFIILKLKLQNNTGCFLRLSVYEQKLMFVMHTMSLYLKRYISMEVLHHSSFGWSTWSHTRWFVARSHNVHCLIIEENARIYLDVEIFFLDFFICLFCCRSFFSSHSSAPH